MRHVLFILLAAVCFGTTGTAAALGPDAGALSVGAARIIVGGGALAGVAWLLAKRRSAAAAFVPVPALAPGSPMSRIPSWLIVALGAAGVVAYQPSFFAGTAANGVAVGTVVALGSAPVLTGALDWAIYRRFPGAWWLLATTIATAGVAVLGLAGSGEGVVSAEPLGLLASVGAGLSYAVYTLAGKELIGRGWNSTSSMGALFGWAAAASIPVLLLTDFSWLATVDGLLMALWLGLVTTTLAYVLFGLGLTSLRASSVATLTLAEPLTASTLGFLVLGERLAPLAVAGLVVLALGIVVLTVGSSRSKARLNA